MLSHSHTNLQYKFGKYSGFSSYFAPIDAKSNIVPCIANSFPDLEEHPFLSMIKFSQKYGYYKEKQMSITLKGIEGAEEIKKMMENMRNNLPESIGNYKVLVFKDIKLDICKDMTTGKTSKTGLPTSNVLYYELENDAWCCVRPSGTEPKIKLYMGVKADSMEKAENNLEDLKQAMKAIVK